jgi:tartrate dehydratase beta subunit/fumarate hydratase class I family protein
MHGFIKRFADGVFYPEEVEILVAAFDDAWAKLQASEAPFVAEGYVLGAREILARRIIMAAKRGERNPRQLTDDALLYLSQQKLSKKPPA